MLPARPYHPRDKAICEAAVQVVERWVIAPLRKHRFFELAAASVAIRGRLSEVLNRPFRGLGVSRTDLFQEERAALLPLPPSLWELATFKRAKVSIDSVTPFRVMKRSIQGGQLSQGSMFAPLVCDACDRAASA